MLSALVSPDSLSPLLTRPEFVSVALVSADSDDSTSLLVDDDLGAPAFLPFEGDVDPVATRSLSSRRRTKRSSAARRMDLERRSDTLEVVGLPRSFDQHHLVAHHPRHQHLASAHQKRTSSSPLLNLSQPLTPRSAGRSCPSRAAFAHALDLPRRRPSHVDQDFLNSTHRRGCRCRWTSAKAERAGDASGLECDAEERKYRWDDKKLVRGGKKAAKHESEHEHGDDTPAPKKVKVAKPSHAASSSAPHASSSTNGHHSSKTHPHRPSSSAKSHKTGKGQSVSRLSTSGPAEGAGTEGTGSSPGGDGSDGGSSGAGSVPGGNGGNGGAAPQAPQPTNSPAVVAPAPNPTTAGTATVAAAGVTAPSGTSTPPGVIAVPSPSLSKIGSAASIVAPATANSVAGGSGPGLLSVLGGKSATSSAVGVSSTSPSFVFCCPGANRARLIVFDAGPLQMMLPRWRTGLPGPAPSRKPSEEVWAAWRSWACSVCSPSSCCAVDASDAKGGRASLDLVIKVDGVSVRSAVTARRWGLEGGSEAHQCRLKNPRIYGTLRPERVCSTACAG